MPGLFFYGLVSRGPYHTKIRKKRATKLLEPEIVDRYAEQAGEIVFTKTHGKKAVGQLTEASRLFWHLGEYYAPDQMVQMGMIVKANKTICHCIGHDDYITPCREYERELIERRIRLHPSTIE